MDHECEGSGHVLAAGPPPNQAAICPVCGRGTKVDIEETDNGSRVTIASHQQVGGEAPPVDE